MRYASSPGMLRTLMAHPAVQCTILRRRTTQTRRAALPAHTGIDPFMRKGNTPPFLFTQKLARLLL